MVGLLLVAFELNSIPLFTRIVVHVCSVAICLGLKEMALYILLETLTKLEDLGMKGCSPDILKKLAEVSLATFEFDSALRFEMKLVESTWFLNMVVEECLAYERLGYIFFMKQDLNQAKIFHHKSVNCQSEDVNGYLRKGTIKFVQDSLDVKIGELKNFNLNWMWVSYWGLNPAFLDESRPL